MIRNMWYAVLESKEVKKDKITSVKRLNEKLVFYRDIEGKAVCLSDKCAHRFAQLSHGKIIDGNIQCPFHGLRYDRSGKCILIPANGKNTPVPPNFKVTSYPAQEIDGYIFIYWSKNPVNIPKLNYFDNLTEDFYHITLKDKWNSHYSRCVENQLDVSHLPFVHQTTIGRGNSTVVDGPVVEWINDLKFHVYVYNRPDDGTPPKKTDDMPQKQVKTFRLEFIFPNIWQNYIFEKFRVTAAFVPVDDENSIVYLRFYQSIVKIPVLKQLFSMLTMIFNKIVLHQDRRVVITQDPKYSELKSGENLFPADLPIVLYRKKRDELKNNN